MKQLRGHSLLPSGARVKIKARAKDFTDLDIQQMFDDLNGFLNRQGDKHFNPDLFDGLHEKWEKNKKLAKEHVEVLAELWERWCG